MDFGNRGPKATTPAEPTLSVTDKAIISGPPMSIAPHARRNALRYLKTCGDGYGYKPPHSITFSVAGSDTLYYFPIMELEFDVAKDAANRAKHGFSLALAEELLSADHVVQTDARFEYGEQREIATGVIDGRVFVCVYTLRGDVYRIISLRKANRREIDVYREGK